MECTSLFYIAEESEAQEDWKDIYFCDLGIYLIC